MVLLAATTFAFAQEKGMHFEHNTTWQKILAKAKAEKKYIFVDCFTTWCGPCKQMSANIFPLKEVGDFYNKNFINVKIQLDTLRDKTGKILSFKKGYSSLVDLELNTNSGLLALELGKFGAMGPMPGTGRLSRVTSTESTVIMDHLVLPTDLEKADDHTYYMSSLTGTVSKITF